MQIFKSISHNYFELKQGKYLLIYFLLFLIYAALRNGGYEGDILCWITWTKYIFNNGLRNTYHSPTDYLPGMHYILWLFSKVEGSEVNIDRDISRIKLIALFFDFIAGAYLIKIIKEKCKGPDEVFYYSLFFFLNISYLYNTLIWGQVDGIVAAFVFMSTYYAIKEKVLLSMICALLALNFKLQAIIFFPLIGLLLLPLFVRFFTLEKLLIWTLIPLLLQELIVSPFLANGDMDKLLLVVTGSVDKCPVISMNAFNMWYLFMEKNLVFVPDDGLFLGISYKQWGLLLFFITSLLALFPLLLDVLKRQKINTDKVLLMASIIPLIFFYFNTQMHERYSHPAIIFIAAWSIRNRKFLPYILVSGAYFLNMESILHHFKLHSYGTLIFDRHVISAFYLLTIVILYVELYKISFNKKQNQQTELVM